MSSKNTLKQVLNMLKQAENEYKKSREQIEDKYVGLDYDEEIKGESLVEMLQDEISPLLDKIIDLANDWDW